MPSFLSLIDSRFVFPSSSLLPDKTTQQERQAEWLLRDFDAAGAVPVSVLLNYLRAELAVSFSFFVFFFFLRFDFTSFDKATTTTRTTGMTSPLSFRSLPPFFPLTPPFLSAHPLFPPRPPLVSLRKHTVKPEHRRGRGRAPSLLHLREQRRSDRRPPLSRWAAPLWRPAPSVPRCCCSSLLDGSGRGRRPSSCSALGDDAAAGARSPLQHAAPAAAAANTDFRGRRVSCGAGCGGARRGGVWRKRCLPAAAAGSLPPPRRGNERRDRNGPQQAPAAEPGERRRKQQPEARRRQRRRRWWRRFWALKEPREEPFLPPPSPPPPFRVSTTLLQH